MVDSYFLCGGAQVEVGTISLVTTFHLHLIVPLPTYNLSAGIPEVCSLFLEKTKGFYIWRCVIDGCSRKVPYFSNVIRVIFSCEVNDQFMLGNIKALNMHFYMSLFGKIILLDPFWFYFNIPPEQARHELHYFIYDLLIYFTFLMCAN